jgi:hypothetical protein
MAMEMKASDLDSAARAAKAAGNPVQALRQLMAANRLEPNTDREILIRDLRITQELYGPRTPRALGDAPAALTYEQGMPACALSEVTPEIVRAAFAARGCLYVPNALDADTTDTLRAAVEGAQNACQVEQPDPRWCDKPKLPTGKLTIGLAGARTFAHNSGGCLAADSPRAMFLICDAFERCGITAIAEDYLGEAPVLAASKFMLWKVPPGPEAGWHQDGRFLGEGMDIASLNVWTALTDCGESAPGMDLVLDYLDHYILAAEDSAFDWAVSNSQVDELRQRVPVVTPRFRAGDILMFDQWLLHRTHRRPDMTNTRYAIESWFFAPSVFPVGRTALLA